MNTPNPLCRMAASIEDERQFLFDLIHDINRGQANMNAAVRDYFNQNGADAPIPDWYIIQRSHLRTYENGVRYIKAKIRGLEIGLAELTRKYFNGQPAI